MVWQRYRGSGRENKGRREQNWVMKIPSSKCLLAPIRKHAVLRHPGVLEKLHYIYIYIERERERQQCEQQ